MIPMTKVLFVCHGNICRSPMAEYIFKDLLRRRGLESQFRIASSATSTEEIGNPMYPPARRILTRNNIPFGNHRAAQAKPSDYDQYDYILIMDERNAHNLQRIFGGDPRGKVHLLLEYAGLNRSISDPWYTGDFQQAFDDICLGCNAFLDYLLSGAQRK